jgi:hypothetical protein
MKFDGEGRVVWSPKEFFDLVSGDPRRTIDNLLLHATPRAFSRYPHYCDFLAAVSERIDVHPKSLVLRRSCQIGFSISPDGEKLWAEFDDHSDLDLAIVDLHYYESIERRVVEWEGGIEWRRVGRGAEFQGRAAERFAACQQDRFYNCCRVDDLPHHLCPHHVEAMEAVADLQCSGVWRSVKAFVYRDWWSLRARYESDIRKLCSLVEQGQLDEPGDRPWSRLRSGPPPRPRRPARRAADPSFQPTPSPGQAPGHSLWRGDGIEPEAPPPWAPPG